MGKARTISGLGGGVLVAALGFIYAGWPDRIRQHPYLVIGLGAVGALMMLAPVIQWLFPIFREESSVPLDLKMQVDDIYAARKNGRGTFQIGHLFLLVSAELVAPESIDLTYALDILWEGQTASTEWVEDVARWARTPRDLSLFSAGQTIPMYPMGVLPKRYGRGEKRDGWLHFTIPPMRESDLPKCVLRLHAKSKRGSKSYDIAANSWRAFGKEYKMVKKPIPDPTPKGFHDLLDKAATTVRPASPPAPKGKPASSSVPPKGETSGA